MEPKSLKETGMSIECAARHRMFSLRGMFAAATLAAAASLPAQARSLLYYYDFEDVENGGLVYSGINRGSGSVGLTGKFKSGDKIPYSTSGAFGSSGAYKAASTQNSLWLGDGSASLGCGTEKGFTMSFWMKTQPSHTAWTNPFGFRLAGIDYRVEYTTDNDGSFTIYYRDSSGDHAVAERIEVPDAGVWKHYAFVFRPNCGTSAGAGTGSIYIDGEYAGATTVVAAGDLQQLHIGTWVRQNGSDRVNQYSDSELDEIAVYDYPATAENVKWLSRNKPAPGIVAARAMPVMWPFDNTKDTKIGLWPGNAGTGTDRSYRWTYPNSYWSGYFSPGALGSNAGFQLNCNPTFRVDGASSAEGLGANLAAGMAISFWLKAPANLGRNWQKIMSFEIGPRTGRYEWQTNDPGVWLFGKENSSSDNANMSGTTSCLSLVPGEWTHLCMNWNRENLALEVYVNGEKKDARWNFPSASATYMLKKLTVGRKVLDGSDRASPANTGADEIAVFNHALSEGQIQWLGSHIPEVTPLDTTNLVRTVSGNATWAKDGGAPWTVRQWDETSGVWSDSEVALYYPTMEDCDVESSVAFADDATLTVDTIVTGKKVSFLNGSETAVSPALKFAEGARFEPSAMSVGSGVELKMQLYTSICGTLSFAGNSKIVLDVSNYDGRMAALSFDAVELPEGESDVMAHFGVSDDKFTLELSQDGKTVYARLDGYAYTATWAGTPGGSLSDPANWTCVDGYGVTLSDALPCEYTRVIGNAALSVPGGTTIPWDFLRFEAGAVTLSQDCDWSAFGGLYMQPGAVVDLAGHRLAVAVAAGKTLEPGNFNFNGGVLSVSGAGTFEIPSASTISAGTLEVAVPLDMAKGLTVENYTALYDGAENRGTAVLNVTGTFTPAGAGYYGCTLQNGSTLDLNRLSGAWEPANIKFAAGTVAVGIFRRSDLKQIAVSEDPYILKWTATTPKPSNVEFVPDAAAASRGYTLEIDDTGIKVNPQPGFMIHIGSNRNGGIEGRS